MEIGRIRGDVEAIVGKSLADLRQQIEFKRIE